MCDYRIFSTDRPVKKIEKVVMLSRENFNKLGTENYQKVLSSDRRETLGLSKSYYYYILEDLKRMGLVEDNAISFKAVIPFIPRESSLDLDNGVLYSSKNHLIFIDMGSSKYECKTCPVFAECIYGIRRIVSEMKIRPGPIDEETARDLRIPSTLWNKLVKGIFGKSVVRLDAIMLG
ncbi:hypothetical protein GWK48_07900 [Metallosphaera tengchongensis]|uniref:Uncharacterized protein n=2 Tax=Metallosphaera tengchongensis TaxID=1532350 RepID=A0A6N0NXY3_9CREN|nr:hypothetical protein GWK48_07900 [Metallosphaera tengchongensis]